MFFNKLRMAVAGVAGILFLAVTGACGSDESTPSIQVFGVGSYQFGQIVSGQYTDAELYGLSNGGKLLHYWTQQASVQVGAEARDDNGLSACLDVQGTLYFPYTIPSDGSTFGYICLCNSYIWTIHDADVTYSIGDPKTPFLSITGGFFPFKYNSDARNFGDYLFRINPYPQYLPTQFDCPYQNLLGFHLSSMLFPAEGKEMNGSPVSSLRQDVLLTSEMYLWPLRDFSLSYLVGCKVFNFADIGGGIMGDRMFSVDENITSPSPLTQTPSGQDFSFAGTKVMARAAIDLKAFMPDLKNVFGENDLRLYSEACWNGLKNYPVPESLGGAPDPDYPGYNDLKKRLPVLIGFNVPTFGALDVLSCEAEWWNDNFANSYWNVYPIGAGNSEDPDPTIYGTHNHIEPYGGPWHWSVYAKKTLLKHLKIIGQVARDHTVISTALTGTTDGDPEEAMDGKGNWGWMAKFEYGF
jgi:hypothetical protein